MNKATTTTRRAFSPEHLSFITRLLLCKLVFNQIVTHALPVGERTDEEPEGNRGFVEAFVASISVILVSEIGDKTFFIAAIMSAQYSRLTVFAGAMSALGIMTAMSAAMGSLTTALIKVEYTRFISNLLFVLFGLRSLREGMNMQQGDNSEFQETDAELKEAEENEEKQGLLSDGSGVATVSPFRKCFRSICSRVLMMSFTMTFLAEWGDRSQITTVLLATHDNPYGVTAGGCVGHFICTGFACLGGRLIAQKISIKHITIFGGFVFLAFAIHGFTMMMLEAENTASTELDMSHKN